MGYETLTSKVRKSWADMDRLDNDVDKVIKYSIKFNPSAFMKKRIKITLASQTVLEYDPIPSAPAG